VLPPPPTIDTSRLRLRPFRADDASAVQRHVSDWEVARTTAAIPHPYPPDGARAWIDALPARHAAGETVALAVTRRDDGVLVGAIELRPDRAVRRAEMGYWIGRPFWGQGFATEAAAALLDWGFRELGLRRLHADTFAHNAASAAVLRRIGMKREGLLRSHHLRWDVLEDVEIYGILHSDARPGAPAGAAAPTSAASPA
jgi:[ribosomal protein S5]-alanine N-acetyltransferase